MVLIKERPIVTNDIDTTWVEGANTLISNPNMAFDADELSLVLSVVLVLVKKIRIPHIYFVYLS